MGAGMQAVDLHAEPFARRPRAGLKGRAELLVWDDRNERFDSLVHVLRLPNVIRGCWSPRLVIIGALGRRGARAAATAPTRPPPSACPWAGHRSWSPRPGRL